MSEQASAARPKPPLIARTEQVVLVILALLVVAALAWRAVDHFRIGAEPLEVIPPPEGPTYRVNLNQADWVTLTLVPGVGEKLAKRIVEQRARRGGRFTSTDQLTEVPGIHDKMLAKLQPYLFVAGPNGDDEAVQMPGGP